MDGQTTPTLYAWSLAAAGTHDRCHHPVFLRSAHLLGMRVRRGHVWAGIDRIVQRCYVCADPGLLSSLRLMCLTKYRNGMAHQRRSQFGRLELKVSVYR